MQSQLTRRVLASPGGGSQKNRTQWVLALLYIFQVSGTPKPEYTFVGRCQGLREPISKQSKAPYVYKLFGTLKQMKDPCAKGRMWSWIAGHSDATILGSLPPLHTPHGQSRGMTDGPSVCVQPALNGVEEALLKIVLWIQPTQKGRPKVVAPKKDCGVDTPALSLLGTHKSPIPEKRMREKQPGSVPRREIPTKRGKMIPWTQPTQKGSPKKDRIPAPKRGARVPLTQHTQKGRPKKDCGVDTPYTPRWNYSKRSVLGLGQSRGIRDTRYTVYMEGEAAPALSLLGPQKSPMREYPGGCPGGRVPKKGTQPTQKGRPQKDRIPIPKRGMWEYPGERNTPGGKTPGENERTPIDRVGNPIGTKRGIARKERVQKEWVLPIGAKSFKEPQSWVTQRVGIPQELAHRGTHSGRPPDPCRNCKLGK